MVVAALGFVFGGTTILLSQDWWRMVIAGAAVFSAVSYLVLWDSKMLNLDGQGAIGLLINLAIFLLVIVACRPSFGF